MRMREMLAGSLLSALAMTGACGSDGTAPSAPTPTPTTTELVSVTPPGGAMGVPTGAAMVMTFSHSMAAGMEQYLDLHQGDAGGPLVPIACTWSADRTTVTCVPGQPLQAHAPYTFHAGGGMMDSDDHLIDMGQHQAQTGGQWLMSGMMGGMHAGAPMSGMGPGWKAANGSYGMVFTFTTG
jgi:Big-like domain-containing protein